jgi:type VI secretion system protein ImpL
LRRGATNNADALYVQLRVYLMLGGDHFNPDDILAWADADWLRRMGDASEEQRQALLAHVAALLERQVDTPLALDKDLVAQSRLVLAQLQVEKRVYNTVKRSLQHAKLKEFSVTEVGGVQAPQVLVRRSGEPLTRGVPGMYSVAGYKKFQELNLQAVAETAKDSWVLAQQEKAIDPAKIEQIKATVQNFYFDDYIKAWDAYLADVTIVPFTSLDQGARIATLLTGAESPVKKFYSAAARETQLESAGTGLAGESMTKAIKDKLAAAKGKLGTVFEAGVDDAVKSTATTKVTNPVDSHFEPLHKLVGLQPGGAAAAAAGASAGAAGAGGAPIDGTLAMLKDVATYLVQANQAKQSGAPAPSAEVLSRLKLEGEGKFAPLGAMIQAVDNSTSGLTKGSERERLSSLWSGQAGPFCRQAIAGRYPMVHSAAQEVTADDFGRMFAPGGVMDDFFQKNLQAYVDTGSKPWRWRPVGNVSLGIAPGVLVEFQRAAVIRDAFFGSGGKQASMRFNLKTLSVDPALSKFSMDIDGQPFVYTTGNNATGSFQVPSGKGNGQIRVETVPATRNLSTDGTWAWFRMMDKGSVEGTPGQGERYKLNFDLDGKRVQLEMTASSVINPFKREILEQFHCLDRF